MKKERNIRFGFKDNIPVIPIYKRIFEEAVLPFLKEHNYRVQDCNITYAQTDINSYNVEICPITDICKFIIDVKIE